MKLPARGHSGHNGIAVTKPPRPLRLAIRSMLVIARLRHCVGVAPPGSTRLLTQKKLSLLV